MIIKLKFFSGAVLLALFLVSSQSNAAQLLKHKTSKTKVAEASGFIPKISSPVTSNFFVPPHLAELQHELDSCESIPQTMRNISRYVTRADVNGDGIDDFIIDFGKIPCLQDTSCGSGGCHHEIWASRNGAWHKAFDAVVQGLKINKGLIQIGAHGSTCNRPSYMVCLFYLVWDGKKFVTRSAPTELTSGTFYYVANTRPPDAFLALRTHPTTRQGMRIKQMPNGTFLLPLQIRNDGWWRVRVIPSGEEGWVLSGKGDRQWVECCISLDPENDSNDEELPER